MMAVIAEKGWWQATMPEIAARSLTNLEEIQRFYPTLHDLLAAYFDEQTWQLLAQPAAQLSPDSPFSHHREYLFALMMNYMDMLQPHRLAYRQMQRAWPTSPRLSRVLLTHAQQFLQQALQKKPVVILVACNNRQPSDPACMAGGLCAPGIKMRGRIYPPP